MERELKISITLFLVFFIYGLVSLISIGHFVVPYFLNPLLVAATSLLFFVMNTGIQSSYLLAILSIGFTCYALQDDFTIKYLSQQLEMSYLIELTDTMVFSGISFLIFFGALFMITFKLYKETHSALFAAIPLIILCGVIAFLFTDLQITNTLFMMAFCTTYFIIAQSKIKAEKSISRIASAILILFTLLEIIEFLV